MHEPHLKTNNLIIQTSKTNKNVLLQFTLTFFALALAPHAQKALLFPSRVFSSVSTIKTDKLFPTEQRKL
jgi:hypothetical protein